MWQRSITCRNRFGSRRPQYTELVKRVPSWLLYSILRLLFIFVPFLVMMAIGIDWLPSILWATLIGLVASLVLLRRPRANTSIAIAHSQEQRRARKSKTQLEDESIEDVRADELRGESGDAL